MIRDGVAGIGLTIANLDLRFCSGATHLVVRSA